MCYDAEFEATMKKIQNEQQQKNGGKQLRHNAFIIGSIFDELMHVQELVILPFLIYFSFLILLLPICHGDWSIFWIYVDQFNDNQTDARSTTNKTNIYSEFRACAKEKYCLKPEINEKQTTTKNINGSHDD